MTEAQAEELRDQLYQAYRGLFGLTDDLIRFTSGGHQEVEIWSVIDEDEMTILVDQRLEAAQHSARAAAGVQRTIELWHKAAAAVILGPRMLMTWQLYSERGFDFPIRLGRPRRPSKLKVVPHDPAAAAI